VPYPVQLSVWQLPIMTTTFDFLVSVDKFRNSNLKQTTPIFILIPINNGNAWNRLLQEKLRVRPYIR